MNLSKKPYWFIKDFILHSIIFFLALMIPTVYVSNRHDGFGNLIGEYLVENLISNIFYSDKPFYISFFYYPIMCFVYSLRQSFFVSIFNIYMINYNKFRKNEDYYYALKILMIFTVNAIYVIWLTLGYGNYIYYLSGIPIMITTIIYLIYKKWQTKQQNKVLHK